MADISKITLPNETNPYNIKDAQARQEIQTLKSQSYWVYNATTDCIELVFPE